jgi:hydrogenase maturation protease
MSNNLILGFGSTVLADECIIPKLLEDLKQEFEDAYEIINELTLALDHIVYFEDFEHIVILDTILETNTSPGRVNHFTLDNYTPTIHLESFHDISLPALLEVVHQLEKKAPIKIVVITITIRENKNISMELSDELQLVYNEVYEHVRSNILNFNNTLKASIKPHAYLS